MTVHLLAPCDQYTLTRSFLTKLTKPIENISQSSTLQTMFDKLLQYFRDEEAQPHRKQLSHRHKPNAAPKSSHSHQTAKQSHKKHKHRPSTHPLTIQPSRSTPNQPVDLDLDLKSQWFVKGQFPPRTVPTKSFTTSSGWSSSGSRKSHWLVAHMRFPDLSSTKIRVTWDGSSPEYTVKAEQRHFPPPPAMSRMEVENCRERYVI